MTSPSSPPESGIPAQMTAKHVALIVAVREYAHTLGVPPDEGIDRCRIDPCPEWREVQSLVSALASRKYVVVNSEQIEDAIREVGLIQDSPYPMERQCGHAVFEMLSRWLSAEPEEK